MVVALQSLGLGEYMRFKFESRIALLCVILLTVIVPFQNCSQKISSYQPTSTSEQVTALRRSAKNGAASGLQNLQYFGFFADGMEHEGSGNYIEATSEVANIHFVSADTLDALTSKIRLAASRNSKVIILASKNNKYNL